MTQDRRILWSGLASLSLHAAAGFTLIFFSTIRQLQPNVDHSIDVEILTMPSPSQTPVPLLLDTNPHAEISSPATSAPPQQPSQENVTRHESASDAVAMIRPSHMLSDHILADPRSRKARATLPKLEIEERMVQICSLEAMAQIEAWQKTYQPDSLVAYAMADTKVEGNTLVADGAAFHSKHQWYNTKFTCDVTPDHMKVQAFAFRVGDIIPQNEWERHDLPADGKHLD
ncbi:MAG TPA: DUF930 domain-containing protein [Beijerinckiaceae bacterium]|jgi:hypothetical protein|nr:DUF930 domain-containing protein [Beijerinckiaceae bacterium]